MAHTRGTSLRLDEAVALIRTGDLWLFRGRSGPDRAIQTLTNSPVNHVGMAVVLDGVLSSSASRSISATAESWGSSITATTLDLPTRQRPGGLGEDRGRGMPP